MGHSPNPAHLIFLIGLPGSGKSFVAAQLMQANPRRSLVSTDAIRATLFGDEATQGSWTLIQREVQQQLQQSLEAGDTIYDATNVRRKHRRAAITLMRSIGFCSITGIWLDTPLSVCLQRNRDRDRQVPEAVIQRMHRQLQGAPPSLSDGLDSLRRYTPANISHTQGYSSKRSD